MLMGRAWVGFIFSGFFKICFGNLMQTELDVQFLGLTILLSQRQRMNYGGLELSNVLGPFHLSQSKPFYDSVCLISPLCL